MRNPLSNTSKYPSLGSPSRALLLLACLACGNSSAPSSLAVVGWTGDDDAPVVLDGELTVRFNQSLAQDFQHHSFQVLDKEGNPTKGWKFSVGKSKLSLIPTRACSPTLEDGSLRPGEQHFILLRGVPHLSAISSVNLDILPGDIRLPFKTLGKEIPSALGGDAGTDDYLLPKALENGIYQVSANADGILEIPMNHPVDPRCLVHPAYFLDSNLEKRQAAFFSLTHNENGYIKLEIQLPKDGSWPLLEFPEELQGAGARLPPQRISSDGKPHGIRLRVFSYQASR